MRIGELAERAGMTTRTLRYYEARGLLPARRTANGYRAYGAADLRLLEQIKTLQAFGFELEETRPFVECLRAGHPAGDSCPASLEVYRNKLAELDVALSRLTSVRDELRTQLGRAEREFATPDEPRCALSGQSGPTAVAPEHDDEGTAR